MKKVVNRISFTIKIQTRERKKNFIQTLFLVEIMSRNRWFKPVEKMFIDALFYHGIEQDGWYINSMPADVDTSLPSLRKTIKNGWEFRTHTGHGQSVLKF